jgi:hypothetical protein
VVQLVGHLTVNEDGEGSNPSAPANFPFKTAYIRVLHWLAMRNFLPVVLFALSLPLQSTVAQQIAKPEVPEKLAAPESEVLVLQAHATGSQVYICQPGPDSKLAWILKAPEADLFDSKGTVIGKHFGGPTWKHNDGSEVVGKVVARQDSPDADSIAWLLLTAANHSGDGILSGVTTIQRLHTKGGQPSASGCDVPHRNTETKVAYSADYYFYRPAN